MKVSDIDNKYQETMKEYQILIEKQNAAARQTEDLQREAETAALAGDLEAYKDLKRKTEDAEALAYVLQKRIEKTGAADLFSKEEISDAWKDYAGDQNKALLSKLKKFRATKTDLLRQYAEMVALQRETCAVRERLCRYIGIEKALGTKGFGLENRFPMEYIPCLQNADAGAISIQGARIFDPDAVYYLSSFEKKAPEMIKDPNVQTVLAVVDQHHA